MAELQLVEKLVMKNLSRHDDVSDETCRKGNVDADVLYG